MPRSTLTTALSQMQTGKLSATQRWVWTLVLEQTGALERPTEITLEQLAADSGLAPRTVSRVLGQLERRGWLSLQRPPGAPSSVAALIPRPKVPKTPKTPRPPETAHSPPVEETAHPPPVEEGGMVGFGLYLMDFVSPACGRRIEIPGPQCELEVEDLMNEHREEVCAMLYWWAFSKSREAQKVRSDPNIGVPQMLRVFKYCAELWAQENR